MQNIINVKDPAYGALGDGVTNDTNAFIAACTVLNAQRGGTLLIPPGVYSVGQQTLAGQTGLGYAYQPSDIIHIANCTYPVVIEGKGAVLRAASGLKYGAFHPVTGQPENTTLPFTSADYAARVGRMIQLENNSGGVVINHLELDGNAATLSLGGRWGTLEGNGRELDATGVWSSGNASLLMDTLNIHHHALDGMVLRDDGMTAESLRMPVTLQNVNSVYNGRNGLRWEGGCGLTAMDCRFNHSGRGALATAVAAGVAVLPLPTSYAQQGVFMNCEMINNVGPGFFSSGSNSSDVSIHTSTLIGTSSYAASPTSPRVHFTDCTLAGQVVYPYADTATDRGRATQFTRCRFTDALDYQGQVYTHASWYLLDFGSASTGVKLTECSIDTVVAKLGYSNGLMTITDTRMKQSNNTGDANLQAVFVGDNTIESSGNNPLTSSIVVGRLVINGQAAVVYEPQSRFNRLLGKDVNGDKMQRVMYYYHPNNSVSATAAQGDIVYNTAPVVGNPVGWICVQGGTSTTSVWKGFGTIVN